MGMRAVRALVDCGCDLLRVGLFGEQVEGGDEDRGQGRVDLFGVAGGTADHGVPLTGGGDGEPRFEMNTGFIAWLVEHTGELVGSELVVGSHDRVDGTEVRIVGEVVEGNQGAAVCRLGWRTIRR